MAELNQTTFETTFETVANTAPAAPLTREQKLTKKLEALNARIAKDTEAAVEVAAELNSLVALAAVDVGSDVVIKLGRKFSDEKDTTRFVAGTVIAVQEDEDGSKKFKVLHGTGFEADVAIVTGAQLSLPPVVGEVLPA